MNKANFLKKSNSLSSIAAAVAVAGLIISCGGSDELRPDPSELTNVFGPDNRSEVLAQSPLYHVIGRLDNGCSGVLIGRQLVLTAGHCVIDEASSQFQPDLHTFMVNSRDSRYQLQRVAIDYTWFASFKPETERHQDWAILRLASPIGEQQGWLGIEKIDFATQLPSTVSLAGYSKDRSEGRVLSKHEACYVHEKVGERLLHDCDSTSGISGAPLLQKRFYGDGASFHYRIVGLTVSEYRQGSPASVVRPHYSREFANVAISLDRLFETATHLLQTADRGIAHRELNAIYELANPNGATPSHVVVPSLAQGCTNIACVHSEQVLWGMAATANHVSSQLIRHLEAFSGELGHLPGVAASISFISNNIHHNNALLQHHARGARVVRLRETLSEVTKAYLTELDRLFGSNEINDNATRFLHIRSRVETIKSLEREFRNQIFTR